MSRNHAPISLARAEVMIKSAHPHTPRAHTPRAHKHKDAGRAAAVAGKQELSGAIIIIGNCSLIYFSAKLGERPKTEKSQRK